MNKSIVLSNSDKLEIVDGVFRDTGVKIETDVVDAEWKEIPQVDVTKLKNALRHNLVGRILADQAHARRMEKLIHKQHCFSVWTRMAKEAGLFKKGR